MSTVSRLASRSGSNFVKVISNMAAGTAVMHLPSTRSTVKKEEPARRVQKIKADEVRKLTMKKQHGVVPVCSEEPSKVDHVVVRDDIFWSKTMTFMKSEFRLVLHVTRLKGLSLCSFFPYWLLQIKVRFGRLEVDITPFGLYNVSFRRSFRKKTRRSLNLMKLEFICPLILCITSNGIELCALWMLGSMTCLVLMLYFCTYNSVWYPFVKDFYNSF